MSGVFLLLGIFSKNIESLFDLKTSTNLYLKAFGS